MKYNLPPRFQKLKLNNAKTLSQPTEPRSEALSVILHFKHLLRLMCECLIVAEIASSHYWKNHGMKNTLFVKKPLHV